MATGNTRKGATKGPGHVFVRGKLHQLIADDLLISTDRAGVVEPTWYEALGWEAGKPPPPGEAPVFRRGQRVFRVRTGQWIYPGDGSCSSAQTVGNPLPGYVPASGRH